jgi:hypothetical protein
MFAGFVFRFSITSDWGPDQQRAWRVVHTFLTSCGGLYTAIGAVGHLLKLGARAATFVVWTLAVSAYAFALALMIGPLVGARGLELTGSAINTIIFIAFSLSSAGGITAMLVVIRGALATLKEPAAQ